MNDSHPALHDPTCRNCAAALTGPYCAQCGQHAHESARSLHVLFHDVWHLLTHVDGRLWVTLQLLLLRPGRLTQEYFDDRRARYVPPFQLYFVISVAFFALAALTGALLGPSVPHGSMSAADRAEVDKELQDSSAPEALKYSVATVSGQGMNAQNAAQLCGAIATGSPWADQRLQEVCRRQVADGGKSMLHEFGSIVPKMMFLFLPVMALMMLALYHSPARYYVEHLVFFLHLQSDLFLVMIVQMLIDRAAIAVPALDPVASLTGMVLFFYALWYSFSALRNYYGQGRTRTLAKFAAIAIAYLACFTLFLIATLALSALVT